MKDGVIDSFDLPVVEGMIYADTFNAVVVTKGDKKYSITYVVDQGDSDDNDDDEWGGDDDDDDEWGSDDGFDWGSHASFLSDETQ